MNVAAIFLVLFCLNAGNGKSLQFAGTVKMDAPARVSIDRAGNIYVADPSGTLFRYNQKGEKQLDYSPSHPAEITLLEAWQGLRIFLFFRDLQQYALLSRYLNNPQGNYNFRNTGFVLMATPSYDNNIWLIDQSDFSMKKYGIFEQDILSSTPFDLLLDPDHYEISFMKEYQNKLFVADKNSGILLFDNLGNFIRKYNRPGLDEFNFFKDYIYFIDGDHILMIDLYDDHKETIPIPPAKNYRHILIFNDTYYLFNDTGMDIYRMTD
jgi:hypothetical protein